MCLIRGTILRPNSPPGNQRGTDQFMTSHEYIQLGMILQRQLGRPYTGRSKWEEGIDCWNRHAILP